MKEVEWKDGEPVEVLLPSASEFCRGMYKDAKGRCSLLGWRYQAIGVYVGAPIPEEKQEFFDKLSDAVIRACGVDNRGGVARFNDDTSNSKTKLAATWRKAVASLGYTKIVDR